MDYIDLLDPALLPLIPVMYAIGYFIKQSKIPSNFIPVMLLVFSILMCFLYFLFNEGMEFSGNMALSSLIGGLFLSMITVGTNELIYQTFIKNSNGSQGISDVTEKSEAAETEETKESGEENNKKND